MKFKIAWIGRTKEPAIQSLTAEYLNRISRYAEVEGLELRDEGAVLRLAAGKSHAKQRHALILLDPSGNSLSSEELAAFVQEQRNRAVPVLFAVGGANGFTAEARQAPARTGARPAPRAALPGIYDPAGASLPFRPLAAAGGRAGGGTFVLSRFLGLS